MWGNGTIQFEGKGLSGVYDNKTCAIIYGRTSSIAIC
jgi:hypothetical protein